MKLYFYMAHNSGVLRLPQHACPSDHVACSLLRNSVAFQPQLEFSFFYAYYILYTCHVPKISKTCRLVDEMATTWLAILHKVTFFVAVSNKLRFRFIIADHIRTYLCDFKAFCSEVPLCY